MRCRSLILPLCAGLSLVLCGCQSAVLSNSMFDPIRPNPTDYRSASDEAGAEWDFVGEEGRSEQTREDESGDRWFKDHLMSPRARSIERNLGFD